MKTLNVYNVAFERKKGDIGRLWVAAVDKKRAKKQTKEYSATITKVISVKRIGNVNVPLVLPAGL